MKYKVFYIEPNGQLALDIVESKYIEQDGNLIKFFDVVDGWEHIQASYNFDFLVKIGHCEEAE